MTLSGLPRTLLLTLRARAEEHARADRLLADPMAADWYARVPQTPELARIMATAYSSVFQLGTAVRARIYDDITQRFLAERQTVLIVELGAGLSTRFYRLDEPQQSWIELDLPPAVALRRTFEAETADHRHEPASMLDTGWLAHLPDVAPSDILFIAEGTLFFLAPDEIRALFGNLTQRAPGATFAFDVLTERFSRRGQALFASVDAPMRWLVEDATAVDNLGITRVQSWVVTHLHLARWEALGFSRGQLLASEGNVIVESVLKTGT